MLNLIIAKNLYVCIAFKFYKKLLVNKKIISFSLRCFSIFVLVFFTTMQYTKASDALIIRGSTERYHLGKYLYVLKDWDGSIATDKILNPANLELFKRDTAITPQAKYHWLIVNITNLSGQFENWHLWVHPHHHNQLYIANGGAINKLSENGLYVKNSESCFPENPRVLKLKIPIRETVQILIKVNTSTQQEYKPLFQVELKAADLEMQNYYTGWIILGVISGILIAISFLILQFWFITRNKSFIFYFLAFFSFMFYFISNDRVAYALFETDYINRFTSNYFALISSFFYLNFSRYFLDVEKRFKSWQKIITWYSAVYILALAIIILIHTKVIWNVTPYLNFIHVVAFILIISFAIYTKLKGVEQAGYYLIANIIFFAFLLTYIIFLYFKLEHIAPNWVASSLKMGTVAQALMFAFAIAHKFNALNREIIEKNLSKEKAEKEKLIEIQKLSKVKNIELEAKVVERTTEIYNQKEELRAQAEQLKKANEEIYQQKKLIEKAHSQITDSIFYASMIQKAVLPKQSLLQLHFKNHFLIFQPRDVISGDFYWAANIDGIRFIAVADCTGHGVPGGFMSMMGLSMFNEIVKREGLTQPDHILNLLRVYIINSLQQESMAVQIRDGIEVALCAIYQTPEDVNNGCYTLNFAGAHMPMHVATTRKHFENIGNNNAEQVASNEKHVVYQLRGDQMPIAMHIKLNPFTLQTVKLFKNDMLYLFTDGITDQIGGSDGRKYSHTTLRSLLLSCYQESTAEQMKIIEQAINDWTNHPNPIDGEIYEQIDDICFIGIRI